MGEVKGMKNMFKKGTPEYKTDTTFVTDIQVQVQGYCENWNKEDETAEKYYIHVKVVDGMAVYMADEADQLDFYETVMNVMKKGLQEVKRREDFFSSLLRGKKSFSWKRGTTNTHSPREGGSVEFLVSSCSDCFMV